MEPFVYTARENAPGLYYVEGWMQRFPGLTVGFTGRNGGVSPAPYHSLNVGLHVGDAPEAVVANRTRLADAVGIPLKRWTYGEQVHGCDVQHVRLRDAGKGTTERESAFQEKDAFITDEPGIVLAALFADCVPLYFYDPVHGAVGLAHGGWKGTVGRVAEHTLQAMRTAFGTNPREVLGAIGPSIGPCCYEVDDFVIGKVRELGLEGPPAFTPLPENKYSLNLQEVNRQIMIKAGILPSHIEMTSLCTGCLTDRFFSHRMENGRTGRMAAWIGRR